jgi:eukaryotic-like serine/threonine-protein kinase
MKLEDWKQIEDLYCAALDSEPAKRAALLAAAAPEVRQAVEKMLTSSTGDQILDRSLWIDSDHFWPRIILDAGTQLGPYTIRGLIGEGGMSSVYRASDLRLNREVAIKVLPQSLAGNRNRLRQFELEARAAGSLNHPNILTVHDVGSQDEMFYLVTELLDGETLRARLNRGKLTREVALRYARMIAAGLAAAHEKGITHRDLKPENLYLTSDDRLKILDFGLAKFAAETDSIFTRTSAEDASRTWPTVLVGTPGYMSPEQVQGLPIDTRSDIFNLGIVIFEMLTGQRPFSGGTPLEIFHNVVKNEPQLGQLPERDPALARFVRGCLEKDPGNRFQSVDDVVLALEKHEPVPGPPAPISRRRAAIYIAGGVSLASGLAWIGLRAGRPPSIPHPLTSRTHGNITTARFTPDGRAIVFSAGRNGKPLETFKMSATGGEPIPLGIPRAGIAGISASDELVLMLDCELNWGECRGTLATRPLAGGEPRELDEMAGKVECADWGPDGELAIVRARRGGVRIEYPIGTVLYTNPTGWISHLRVSPKGDRLAFLNHPERDTNFASVEVVDLKAVRTMLVSARQGVKGLAWSPAGDEVWFSGTGEIQELRAVRLNQRERIVRSLSGWFELLDIARDGRVLMMQQKPADSIVFEPERARQSPFIDTRMVDLSSDGNRVLIIAGRNTRLLDTETGESKQLGEGKPLALSRDGQWALATRSSPNPELVLFSVRPGEPRRLPRTDVAAYLAGLWVDSNHVVFVGQHADGSVRSYSQSIEGGLAQPIGDPDIRVALASPDGTELAAYGRESDRYYRLSISGEPRPLFRGLEPYDELLQWGSDQSLYVRSSEESRVDLFHIDLVTGSRKLFKRLVVPDPVGFIGIESTRVTPDGSTVVYDYWTALGELYLLDGVL